VTDLHQIQSQERRATMSAEQRAALEQLAIVTERFHQRNLRMDLGLRIGFRKLEESPSDARIALNGVK
jgi:hypothetical protein